MEKNPLTSATHTGITVLKYQSRYAKPIMITSAQYTKRHRRRTCPQVQIMLEVIFEKAKLSI